MKKYDVIVVDSGAGVLLLEAGRMLMPAKDLRTHTGRQYPRHFTKKNLYLEPDKPEANRRASSITSDSVFALLPFDQFSVHTVPRRQSTDDIPRRP